MSQNWTSTHASLSDSVLSEKPPSPPAEGNDVTAEALEPLLSLAKRLGVKVLLSPTWQPEQGAWYGVLPDKGPFVLLSTHEPIGRLRWLLAHELGHHLAPRHIGSDSLRAENEADLVGYGLVCALYQSAAVDLPTRVRMLQEVA